MELGNTSTRIGSLVRTVRVETYDWGVRIVKEDRTDGTTLNSYEDRNFKNIKRYQDVESNIKRGMKYYRMPDKEIMYMVNLYRLSSNQPMVK